MILIIIVSKQFVFGISRSLKVNLDIIINTLLMNIKTKICTKPHMISVLLAYHYGLLRFSFWDHLHNYSHCVYIFGQSDQMRCQNVRH